MNPNMTTYTLWNGNMTYMHEFKCYTNMLIKGLGRYKRHDLQ